MTYEDKAPYESTPPCNAYSLSPAHTHTHPLIHVCHDVYTQPVPEKTRLKMVIVREQGVSYLFLQMSPIFKGKCALCSYLLLQISPIFKIHT